MTVAGDGDARAEEFALIELIFYRNPGGNRLQALESRRGLKMRALLAAVESGVTLWAVSLEICPSGQHCGATIAT